MSHYEIIFTGQVVPGARLAQVQSNLARLFQADEQRVATLFSGRRLVLKSNLDAAAAQKYRATLERAGAQVQVVPMAAAVEEIELSTPAAAPAAKRAQVVPRDAYMAAFAAVDAPDFAITELGTTLQDAPDRAPAPALDLGQFSLAPTGADLGQAKTPPAGPAPDTSHLKIVT
jgi:hypothetical protein